MTAPAAMVLATFDVDADREEELLAWHTDEHLPERMRIQGFRVGRRLRNLNPVGPRFAVMYELASAEVMTSPAYLERLDDPTPWTRRSLRVFRNGRRTVLEIAERWGTHPGAFVDVFEIPGCTPMSYTDCPVVDPAVCRITWGKVDVARSSIATTEARLSGNRPHERDVLITEADDETELDGVRELLEAWMPELASRSRFAVQAMACAAPRNAV